MAFPPLERRARPVKHIDGIPVALAPPDELPFAAAPGVIIEIADRHHHPFAAILVLGPAINLSGRMVCVDKCDAMSANLVDRTVKRFERLFDCCAKSLAARSIASAIDVFNE